MKPEAIVAFLFFIGLGIWGFFRSRELRDKHKAEIEHMKELDSELRKDLPFNAYWHYGDSAYQKYKDNQAFFIWGIIFFIIFLLALFGVVTIR